MEVGYLENLNFRLETLGKNNLDVARKDTYVRLFAESLYSIFYGKGIKIDDDALADLLRTVLDGVVISGKRYGGVYKIFFSEMIDRYCDLVRNVVVPKIKSQKIETALLFLPHQRKGKFEVNSFIFAFYAVKILRENGVAVRNIRNIGQVQNAAETELRDAAFLVMDDYSLTGKNLKDRISKVSKFIPESVATYFIYCYCYSDTLYHVLSGHIKFAPNSFLFFHTLILNFPVLKFNVLERNNSRFFCINKYYELIFYFLESMSGTSKSNSAYKNIYCVSSDNPKNWYDFCAEISRLMDKIDRVVQKYLSVMFYDYHNFRLHPSEFYIPTTQIVTDYEAIGRTCQDNSKNTKTSGKTSVQGHCVSTGTVEKNPLLLGSLPSGRHFVYFS